MKFWLRSAIAEKSAENQCPLQHQHITSKEKMLQFQTGDIYLQDCVAADFNVVEI